MFYDNFINACANRGRYPSRVLAELGLSKGSLSNWKAGGEPFMTTKKRIADHLGISLTELENEAEKTKIPAIQKDDEEETRRAMRFYNKMLAHGIDVTTLTADEIDKIMVVVKTFFNK